MVALNFTEADLSDVQKGKLLWHCALNEKLVIFTMTKRGFNGIRWNESARIYKIVSALPSFPWLDRTALVASDYASALVLLNKVSPVINVRVVLIGKQLFYC